jgi:hypothetical protein
MATTVKELIAKINEWFPDENELVYSIGIVSKETFLESSLNLHEELPDDWVMPDDLFKSICNAIDGLDYAHEKLWEAVSEVGDDFVREYLEEQAEAVNDEELWEEEQHEQ